MIVVEMTMVMEVSRTMGKEEVSRDRPLFKAYPRRVVEGGYPLHWS
jgi:hypothetical protein